jgi:hypothetical protein
METAGWVHGKASASDSDVTKQWLAKQLAKSIPDLPLAGRLGKKKGRFGV